MYVCMYVCMGSAWLACRRLPRKMFASLQDNLQVAGLLLVVATSIGTLVPCTNSFSTAVSGMQPQRFPYRHGAQKAGIGPLVGQWRRFGLLPCMEVQRATRKNVKKVLRYIVRTGNY